MPTPAYHSNLSVINSGKEELEWVVEYITGATTNLVDSIDTR